MTGINHFWEQATEFVQLYGWPCLIASAVIGAVLGLVVHYYLDVRPLKQAQKKKQELLENEISERNETSRIKTNEEIKEMLMQGKGKINVKNISKRNRVAFNPKVEENVPSVVEYSEASSEEDEEDEEHPSTSNNEEFGGDDEEQMPQINKRRVMSSTTRKVKISDEDRPIDTDRITSTLGKLHGKLATAQLKAKTRKMAAEMSAEERDYEAQMKAKQMESIMALMLQNKEKFGISKEEDIQEQLNLYNF